MIGEELAEPGSIAEHLADLADVAVLRQEWSEAVVLFRRSHRVYKEIGDRGGIARTRLGMGMVAQQKGELDAARNHCRLALAVAVEAQVMPVVLSVLTGVGNFLLSNSDTRAQGQRALAFVLQHPSCDAQRRRTVVDSLARYGIAAREFEPASESLEELVAVLQFDT